MELTPAMRQYWDVKRKYDDCIVLFRMGDFYETFYDDAKTVANDLNIVLTNRGKGDKKAPLAGIPYHALDTYLKKLVDKGHKVVIVEQLEDPKKAKGLVKRGVVRIVTPGTVIEPHMIDEKSNNYIMSFYSDNRGIGLCACDVSTGEMHTTETDENSIETEIEKYKPSEIIVPKGNLPGYEWVGKLSKQFGFKISEVESYKFDEENGSYLLNKMFGVRSFSSYGLDEHELSRKAISGMLSYLDYTLLGKIALGAGKISYYAASNNMLIDAITIRNLDLVRNQVDGSERGTLLSVFKGVVTPMGNRLIKKFMLSPLADVKQINERLDNVGEVTSNPMAIEEIKNVLKHIGDVQRISARISYETVLPRELLMLKQSLENCRKLKKIISDLSLKTAFYNDFSIMDTAEQIENLIRESIDENAKSVVRDGGVIKQGYSEELDRIKELVDNSKKWLTEFEQKEREKTGIRTLKVRYNKIIGYFIEVPKSKAGMVPKAYVRKQTQVATERYISPELKEIEVTLLNSEEKIRQLESEIYAQVVKRAKEHVDKLHSISDKIAELDVYMCFAELAHNCGYCRPSLNNDGVLDIKEGRHPVVESAVVNFIPNDVRMDCNNRIAIITGPNMAGKSTIMRQVALICIMAQMGCYVPAKSANLAVFDRIFTRVGARDDIWRGQSTFMMEMTETANILNNATENSLVILDEIGRGTSTYDGMAIAWAIVEYIAENIKCKTLFATHYHLLNLIALKYGFVKNYNVAVKEEENGVVFMHKLCEGGTDKSYGVHVAKIAGLPNKVVQNASKISKMLEQNDFLHRETLSRLTKGGKSIEEDKQTSINIWSV